MSSQVINKLIGAPNHEENKYSILMDEEVGTTKLVKKLSHTDKRVIWATGKKNQNLSFNVTTVLQS